MGLFDEPYAELRTFLQSRRELGKVKECPDRHANWSSEKTLVLKSDTAIELGSPSFSSLMLLLWADSVQVPRDRIYLIGPDLAEAGSSPIPFGQVVIVGGCFADEYDSYRDLKEAVYNCDLRGISSRALPSKQEIWLRISRDAIADGFDLDVLGSAMIDRLKRNPPVEAVEVLFVTDKEELAKLRRVGEKVQTIVSALTKMYEEMNFDCDTCEYVEVCDEVVELRRIRNKLRNEQGCPD